MRDSDSQHFRFPGCGAELPDFAVRLIALAGREQASHDGVLVSLERRAMTLPSFCRTESGQSR